MDELLVLAGELWGTRFQTKPAALNRRAALGADLAELVLAGAVALTDEELELVIEALDSHAYWQLSDAVYRRDGYVQPPGSDNPEQREALAVVGELHDRLEALQRARGVGWPGAAQG